MRLLPNFGLPPKCHSDRSEESGKSSGVFIISWTQYQDWNAGLGMVKSPFEKGGCRGIPRGYIKSPLNPLFQRGIKIESFSYG